MMGKMIITAIMLLTVTVCSAQGIRFEKGLPWSEVLLKAKRENKYIFVSAISTSNRPSSEMEAKVYPDSVLGAFATANFISVKVQMDRPAIGDGSVQQWYSVARKMGKEYSVTVFPTYLFFSPEGKIVHRGQGLMGTGRFRRLMEQALDIDQQYYGRYRYLLADYGRGNKNYAEMPYMVRMAVGFGEHDVAKRIALDYIHNHLLKMEDKELYTRENLGFIKPYVSSGDKEVFGIFYPNGNRADSVVMNISKQVLSEVITREEIDSRIVRDNDYKQPKVERPKWGRYEAKIKKKYGVDGGREINAAKRRWYKVSRPDGDELARSTIEYFNAYAPISKSESYLQIALEVNSALYEDVAKRTDDTNLLSEASVLQREAIDKYITLRKRANKKMGAVWALLDTYACLLYKAGDKSAALANMERALEHAPEEIHIRYRIAQMKSGKSLILD